MAHCPYCGESISEGAAQCPKCGVVLDEDAAPAAAGKEFGGAGAAAVAEKPAAKKTEPCPKCDKPVKVNAHRCPYCGFAIRDIVSAESRKDEASFQRTVKLGVAGVLAAVVIAFLVIGWLGGSSRPKNPDYAKIAWSDLSTLVGPAAKSAAARQKEHWIKYEGKFVRWDGRIVEIEAAGVFGGGALLIRHRPGAGDDADVRLALPKAELAKAGVQVGARVNYTGRLVSYGSSAPGFTLADGQVVSAK